MDLKTKSFTGVYIQQSILMRKSQRLVRMLGLTWAIKTSQKRL